MSEVFSTSSSRPRLGRRLRRRLGGRVRNSTAWQRLQKDHSHVTEPNGQAPDCSNSDISPPMSKRRDSSGVWSDVMAIQNALASSTATASRDDVRLAYRDIRNYLAGQVVGATRDAALLGELIRALFCAHYLFSSERLPGPTAGDDVVLKAYSRALASLKGKLPEYFPSTDEFISGSAGLSYIHRRIWTFDFDNIHHDYIGDVYEAFTGTDFRGQEGQFFTPQPAVNLLLEITSPKPGERVIDPACGAGGFLSATARRLIDMGASRADANQAVHGIDKDHQLAQLAGTRLAFLSFSHSNVRCADSLGWRNGHGDEPSLLKLEGNFDVVLTNPPFGSKIVAASPEVLTKFDLGHKWATKGKETVMTTALQRSVPPQVLFIERCLSLVRPGGRVGMVVPESLISGRNYRHVVSWLRSRAELRAVLGMPEALFKTSGKGGTHTKTCLIYFVRYESQHASRKKGKSIFMAEARWCGNDSRGRSTGRDDLPEIGQQWRIHLSGKLRRSSHLGYPVAQKDITDQILAPRYYDPEVAAALRALANTHELVKIGDLVEAGVLTITTGHEVGAENYGTGVIPFVRTSDLSNWEIKLDPKQGISEEVFNTFSHKQDVQEGDILMVRDGTYLVGTCAYVTQYDTRMVFQSHILKIRVNDRGRLSPFLLLAALSSAPVHRQIISKRFTQDIIDTLGNRVHELVLPLPKHAEDRRRIELMVQRAIHDRVEARELARQARLDIIGSHVIEDSDV